VARALEEPLRWIAGNAGVEGSIVVDKVKRGSVASLLLITEALVAEKPEEKKMPGMPPSMPDMDT
jgi:chaperonin GroEL